MNNHFINPFIDNLKLKRYPVNTKLQAWDSADELILNELKINYVLDDKRILIINDSFGALSLSLKEFNPTVYTDSYTSFMGINSNGRGIEVLNDLSYLKKEYDLVLIKIPKSLSFFEDILAHLTNVLKPNTFIIFGGMVKYLTKNYFELIEKYIGEATTSLAQKKARLIFSSFKGDIKSSPFPQSIYIEELKAEFINHSNLFSRNKLDIGTRFFLEYIPSGNYKTILDLGCANGIIGIKAKLNNPNSNIIFTDESFMAIKSSQENYNKFNFKDEASYLWTNCYENPKSEKLDLVLCNPPFHQNNTIGDHIALQMFTDACKALDEKGQIRVIGNSHLGYHKKLKMIFGNSKIIAQNSKFMIIDAIKK